jgi:hypothetical protein
MRMNILESVLDKIKKINNGKNTYLYMDSLEIL